MFDQRLRGRSAMQRTDLGLVRVERETVQDQIYIALRDKLMRGGFEPGQGLKIAMLADAFGTSAMPVREALNRLTAERALEALPNRTVRVPTLTRERLADLKEARFAVEGLAVARAASCMSDETLTVLHHLIDTQREHDAGHFSEASTEENRAFHFAIYRQSGSTVLLPIIESLWLQFGPYLRSATEKFDGREGQGTRFHVDIVDALAQGDGDAARVALQADIGRAFDLVMLGVPDEPRQSGAA
jgi:DNA-binding GntR family transcriptional regulator